MSERELIAERIIYAVDKDSRGFEIRLMIGKPYQTDSKYGDWACPVAMMGLHGVFRDMYGVDSWQALTVAHALLRKLLAYFVEDGGKLFWKKGGEELSLDELFGESPEIPEPDGPPNDDQQSRIDQLSAEDIRLIDKAIMANVAAQWRKMARVAASAMEATESRIIRVPDLYYAERIRKLVAEGKLEYQGYLMAMRFCEVRVANGT